MVTGVLIVSKIISAAEWLVRYMELEMFAFKVASLFVLYLVKFAEKCNNCKHIHKQIERFTS